MYKTPLRPFGIEITGVDVRQLKAPALRDVAELIARSRVAVFRQQAIDDAEFVHFLGGLGELTFTAGEQPVSHAPDLNIVSNLGRLVPPRSVFHTDTSYVKRPPALTGLRPVILPAIGGDTLFSDQVGAASRLPEAIRRRLLGQDVLHKASGLEDQSSAIRQPLLRRHPITKETSLYLSTPQRCTDISNLDTQTSQRLIAALYWHSTRTSLLYRHQWKAGDVLIWDNRVTMHRADHGSSTAPRLLHRGMVLGEIPLFAS